MKHKMLLALLGSMLGATPLWATAQATVTLYGVADVQAENVRTSGSAAPALDKPSRWRVSNVSSDLGVKGSVPIGEGFTGLFQYSTGVNVDSSNLNAAGGIWGNAKDTFVGVSLAGVGTLKLGRLTAAARWASGTADFSPAGAGPQDDQAALSGASGQSAAGPLFNVRLDNTLGFESASFYGLSVRAYYSANENKSSATAPSGAQLDDSSFSLGAQYVLGPIDLRGSYEVRNDKGTLNNTTNADTKDKDARLGLRFTVRPGTTLALAYDVMSLHDSSAVGAVKNHVHKSGWVVGANQEFGKHVVYGGFGKAGNLRCAMADGSVCSGTDTGMKQWVLAYLFNVNKQMLFEAFASQLSNQARARYDYDSGGVSPGAGAKLTAVGAGVRYVF